MGNTNTYVLQDLACTKIKTRKEKKQTLLRHCQSSKKLCSKTQSWPSRTKQRKSEKRDVVEWEFKQMEVQKYTGYTGKESQKCAMVETFVRIVRERVNVSQHFNV